MAYKIPYYKTAAEIGMDVVVKQVAALCAVGTPPKEIAKELGISLREVKEIVQMPTCKEAVHRIGEEAINGAKQAVKARTAGLVDAIMSNLEANIRKNNLNAVPIALNILGLTKDAPAVQDTSITVMLPGQPTPIKPDYKEVKNEVQGTESSDTILGIDFTEQKAKSDT